MNSRESKQIINVEKIIIGLKNKKKREREAKGNSTELQMVNVDTEVYNSNKKCDRRKKGGLKTFIIFHIANEIGNDNVGGEEGAKKKKKKNKESSRIYKASQNMRITQVFL